MWVQKYIQTNDDALPAKKEKEGDTKFKPSLEMNQQIQVGELAIDLNGGSEPKRKDNEFVQRERDVFKNGMVMGGCGEMGNGKWKMVKG